MAGRTAPKRFNRREEITRRIEQEGFASIEDLADAFRVTPQTIRRDINGLCEQGVLRRYHGGAGLARGSARITHIQRKNRRSQAKRCIGKLVAHHVPDNASLFISIGSTAEAVATALMNHESLRVITNSLNVAHILSEKPGFEVIIAGGAVHSRDKCVTGQPTVDFIEQFKVDFGVIGISAIDEDGALLEADYHGVRVTQAIIKNSRDTLLVADRSKCGRKGMARLGFISEVNTWFTDRKPPESLDPVLASHRVAVKYPGE